MALPIVLAREKNDSRRSPHLFFSPKGQFAVLLVEEMNKRDVHLWDVTGGGRLEPKSAECDYFSLPAAFSPDESRLACVDGDFLRLWDLKARPVALLQSSRLPRPKTTRGTKDLWTRLVWARDEAMVLGLEPDDPVDRSYQVLTLAEGRGFEARGPSRISPQKSGRNRIRYGTIAVSPDGRTVASAIEPDPEGPQESSLVVRIADAESGNPLGEISFPKAQHGLANFPWPNLGLKLETNSSSFEQNGACLEFSPDGRFLFVATQTGKTEAIEVLSTSSWRKTSSLEIDGDSSSNRRTSETFRLGAFSPDGNLLAATTLRKSRTSRGEKVERVALVYELATGKLSREIPLGDAFVVDSMSRIPKADQEKLEFTPDGRSLVVAVVNKDGWNKKNNRAEASWAAGSWRLDNGGQDFDLSGLVLGTNAFKAIKLAPGGAIAVTTGETLQVWDLPRLARLRADLDEADRAWVSKDLDRAFDHYCAILADSTAWFLEENLPRVYSRCLDVFAGRGEVLKGRSLVQRAGMAKIDLKPESAEGRKLIDDFVEERAEARRVASRQRSETEIKRLADVRARNQRAKIAPGQLTKRQFIDQLRQQMTHGRIDNLATYAIFEDFAFDDVFGEPDSNVEWVNFQRLFTYRCRDGAVQLTVTILGPQTILQGINQF